MRSNPDSLLSGLLLTGGVFVVLWFVFSAFIFFVGLSIGAFDLFRPHWYQEPIIAVGGAVLAVLSFNSLRVDSEHA